MANTKGSALTQLTDPQLTDELIVTDDPGGTPITKRATVSSVLNLKADWTEVSDTWTYASATTITVPTDATTTYQKNDRIRWKQGGAYKYGVIKSVSATLITLIATTDYSVANSAISDIAYSRAANPFGFPDKFNFSTTPTYSGGTTNPTSNTVNTAYWRVIGSEFIVTIKSTLVRGSGDRTFTLYPIPVTASEITSMSGWDNITASGGIVAVAYASSTDIYHKQTMANDGSYYINGSLQFT